MERLEQQMKKENDRLKKVKEYDKDTQLSHHTKFDNIHATTARANDRQKTRSESLVSKSMNQYRLNLQDVATNIEQKK